MKKPILKYDSRGQSGNIYWILGELSKIMRKQSKIVGFNKIRDRVFEAGSYEEALAIISEKVELVDTSKK